MNTTTNTNVERIDGPGADPGEMPAMLTVHDVARMLNCSDRTVYRLTDSGRMPKSVKLGTLVRWSKTVIERWITNGCPNVHKEVRK